MHCLKGAEVSGTDILGGISREGKDTLSWYANKGSGGHYIWQQRNPIIPKVNEI